MANSLSYLSITFIIASISAQSIWPMPKSAVFGTNQASLSSNASFVIARNGQSPTLTAAFDRYRKIMFSHAYSSTEFSSSLQIIEFDVVDLNEFYPQLETDESYYLDIPVEGTITIRANNVFGALYGLETLSQVVNYDYDTACYVIDSVPLQVEDAPRFPHRGLLLDTSRHFQPIVELERIIDALSYSKLNVLHWHVVDTQSFPYQSEAFPELWKGSYSKPERYRQEDIAALVEYGRQRGVRVMVEFDIPGHAASWCTGYPEICPSTSCLQPLNPASNLTFQVIEGLLTECATIAVPATGASSLFPYNFIHLGGDEVDYKCWVVSEEIQSWAVEQGYSSNEDIYKYFLDRSASFVRSLGRMPVQWVEVFEHFGAQLNPDTIVHVWKEKSTLDSVLLAGYRALLSDNDLWYLDNLQRTWEDMYSNEPLEGLDSSADVSLLLGGEACMWGETVDPSDLDNTIWPRAAAVAERLWTPVELMDVVAALERIEIFRCVLTQRGIGAAPVLNKQARNAPRNPGSCFAQRRAV